ncbi:MAG: stage II sporulation protein M [Gammaproteobacteria bacterium]
MNQERFEQLHQAQWQQLEQWLEARREKKRKADNDESTAVFPHLYRQVCHHLALARERHYSNHLVERLNKLALEGHTQLYRSRTGILMNIVRFVLVGFPVLVRRESRVFWLAALLFYGPLVAMWFTVQQWPDVAYSVMSAPQTRQYEQMYSPDRKVLGRERQADSNFYMFGVYIWNNIGIGFRTFATGLLFGLGSLFLLIFNGVVIGTVAGHLTHLGYISTFYSFVVGHSAFELTAIVISGAAGLKLGLALIRPGRRSRLRALREAAAISVRLIFGVILFLVIAAFIEAFWSSTTAFAPQVKYFVGGLLWLTVISYLLLMGRGRET